MLAIRWLQYHNMSPTRPIRPKSRKGWELKSYPVSVGMFFMKQYEIRIPIFHNQYKCWLKINPPWNKQQKSESHQTRWHPKRQGSGWLCPVSFREGNFPHSSSTSLHSSWFSEHYDPGLRWPTNFGHQIWWSGHVRCFFWYPKKSLENSIAAVQRCGCHCGDLGGGKPFGLCLGMKKDNEKGWKGDWSD